MASSSSASLEDAFALTLLRDLAPDEQPPADAVGTDEHGAVFRWARQRCADVPRLRRLWQLRGWFTARLPGPWLIGAAALTGLAGASLGSGGELNVLTPPLLGLLGWQLVVFALLGLHALPGSPRKTPLPTMPAGIATRIAGTATALDADAARRLTRGWFERAHRPVAARWAATLHLGAAAIALGAIAGLYLDGLGTAYTARWESTFLDAGQVAALARLVLGPASLLTGIPLPDAAGFARLADAGAPAAPWVHLWATTLLGAAVLPRCALALLAWRRGSRPLLLHDDPWLRQRLARASGRQLALVVQPVGYRPAGRSQERLAEALTTRHGAHVLTDRREPLPWDAEPDLVAGLREAGAELVVLVSAAQTPEEEVHGPLLDALAGAPAADAGAPPLLVVVDTGAYAAQRDRRESRVAAWGRLAQAHGAELLALEDGG